MMKNYILAVLVLVIIGVTVYCSMTCFSSKIAYVKSGELVNKYEGMKEARELYKEKIAKWQLNIDTLEADYQRSVSEYNLGNKSSGLSRKEQEILLDKQRNNIQQYVKTLDEKARQEDDKMTEGVINQINSFIEEYGKSHGYDFILGTTQQGNIMYGAKGKDITEEVLKELNESYTQKQKK